jgi:perosamine synthetase
MSTEPAPAKPFIPLSVPTLGGNEWRYIKECLDTNWVSYLGAFVDRFEKDLAEHSGAAHAVAMTSGTAALHIALLVAGVEPESEVVMPGITFVAPANAVRYVGAWPVLIDLDERDWQIDTGKLADFLENGCSARGGKLYNRATGRRIAALMPVHLLGDMCDVDEVAALASRFDLPLIEDAAECVGAGYRGRGFAAPTPAIDPRRRMVCASFNGNKIVTTGGGGAVLTGDSSLASRAKHLSTTAKTRALEFFHDEVGFNYRMTNLAAAMGVAQLERLPEFAAVKRATAAAYRAAFAGDERITPHPSSPWGDPIYWLYTVMVPGAALPVVEKLNAAGVQSRPVWTPIWELPAFSKNTMVHSSDFAQRFHLHALSLPSSVSITPEEIARVVCELRNTLV